MLTKSICAAILLLIMGNNASFSNESVPVLNPFEGKWVVSEVTVNGMQLRRLYINYNDPAYKNRFLYISKDSLTGNLPEFFWEECKPLKIKSVQIRASDLLTDDTYFGEAHFKDYGMAGIPDERLLNAYIFNCGETLFGKTIHDDAEIKGTWLIELQKDKIAMRWYDNSILILERTERRFFPTFNCEGRLNDTERTICNSDELSGYDISLAAAYKDVVMRNNEIKKSPSMENFFISQKKWIINRNKCGKNTKCIEASMVKRINVIRDFNPDDDPN